MNTLYIVTYLCINTKIYVQYNLLKVVLIRGSGSIRRYRSFTDIDVANFQCRTNQLNCSLIFYNILIPLTVFDAAKFAFLTTLKKVHLPLILSNFVNTLDHWIMLVPLNIL